MIILHSILLLLLKGQKRFYKGECMKPTRLKLNNFEISNDLPFVLIAGPCALESATHALFMAEEIKKICDKLGIHYIFKASFDKANRSSAKSKRGAGMEEAVKGFKLIKQNFNLPTLTDFHDASQTSLPIMEYIDIIQVPAFLSRQTDILKAAAETKKIVHVKKGQFMAPAESKNIVSKLEDFGSKKIMLCDRGTSFGYNTLINDMTGLKIMAETGYPVIMDATHSVQRPAGQGDSSGGDRSMIEVIANAAVAVGVAGLFLEVHQDPDSAPCDGPNMLKLNDLERILAKLVKIDQIVKK